MSSEPAIKLDTEIAIELTDISKCYPIYQKPQHRLLQSLLRGRKQLYREFWALRNITLSIQRGESIGIIGRNGAGKSTLLQVICGILQPSSGEVRVRGRVAALLELGAGFNPDFTGRENVFMAGAILGLGSQEISEKFDAIAEFADIGDYIEQPVKTYSSGMYVRLAFAVIVHVDADILIIDEALAVGDAFFTQKCMRFLRKYREVGTLLFVSHDTAAVMNFCDRAVWLENGAMRQLGLAEDVTQAYLQDIYESADKMEQEAEVPTDADETVPEVSTGGSYDSVQVAYWDQRRSLINATKLRNDIEVFQFDEQSSSFGEGGGRIVDVSIRDSCNRALSWVVGGEKVQIFIECQANTRIDRPVMGFFIKDRLGQYLFGDNSYESQAGRNLGLQPGNRLRAQFSFAMPLLPVGEYCVVAGLGDGNNESHVMHHWLHEALVFKSHSSSVSTGLIGIPIDKIELMVRHE